MAIAPTNRELQLRLASGHIERMIASGSLWTLESVLNSFPELGDDEESLVEIIYLGIVCGKKTARVAPQRNGMTVILVSCID